MDQKQLAFRRRLWPAGAVAADLFRAQSDDTVLVRIQDRLRQEFGAWLSLRRQAGPRQCRIANPARLYGDRDRGQDGGGAVRRRAAELQSTVFADTLAQFRAHDS